uniref:hypothetical protein n=1 Tax=Teichococcus vastitatis TaxID=2307076 RepID=UPI000E716597
MSDVNSRPDLSRMTGPESLRRYMAYQEQQGRQDLYWAAFRRLCEIEGRAHDGPLETDFWRAIIAGEELLQRKHGKRVLLSRTRQKIGRVGILKTVEDLVQKKTASDGFALLVEGGLHDLTAEYLAIKHAHL